MVSPSRPKPSKLLALKEWLTLDDAAKHLSLGFGEEVTRADVLRLALDGRLTLSVDFVNHARAKKGRLVALEECPFVVLPGLNASSTYNPGLWSRNLSYSEISTLGPEIREAIEKGELVVTPGAIHFRDGEFLVLEEEVKSIDGVWDLPMVASERIDVEHLYQMETNGPQVTLMNIEGAFVVRDDVVCQLQEDWDDDGDHTPGSRASGEALEETIREEKLPKEKADELRAHHRVQRARLREKWKQKPSSRYYPAGNLPHDAVYVVRASALRAFEQSVLNTPSAETSKALSRREETTLLNIVGGLLGLLLGKSPSGKALSVFKSQAAIIEALLATYPGKPGISARTLEDKLAQARRSLED
jgi:hypothetical protein